MLRKALAALKREEDDVLAVREALADLDARDRGQPFDEFAGEFRRTQRIPTDASVDDG